MKKYLLPFLVLLFLNVPTLTKAQTDPDEMGAWYMYIFSTQFKKDSLWGIQGDIQHRNFNILGDLQQLLLRGGITYMPKESPLKLTLGYAYISTGTQGDSNESIAENRFYQETSFPVKLGQRIFSLHRFRYEMRFVENQDFRTRYRYNLFINIPLNTLVIEPKTIYLSFYNELFINGERKIGNGKTVPFFDRNRLYGALGYVFRKGLKMQFGMMRQTSNSFGKNQLQLSLHHNF
jgi:hypothetical protein